MGNLFSSKSNDAKSEKSQSPSTPALSSANQINNNDKRSLSSNLTNPVTSVSQNISTLTVNSTRGNSDFSCPTTTTSPTKSYVSIAAKNCTMSSNISSTRFISLKTTISNADLKKFQQSLYSAVLNQCRLLNWNFGDWNMYTHADEEYQLVNLEPGTYEYNDIFDKFSEYISGEIYVVQIVRVENPYLMGQYFLKKLEYQNKDLPVEERDLFHGTKGIYVDNICKNNFDWRLHGQTKGNIFGKGVSFTPKSRYANHYCDVHDKVMIVAKVLVSSVCEGSRYMTIPDYYDKNNLLRYDTSVKEPTKDVLVKYCDDEFYPAYLINFIGQMYYSRPYPNMGFYR